MAYIKGDTTARMIELVPHYNLRRLSQATASAVGCSYWQAMQKSSDFCIQMGNPLQHVP